MSTEVTFSLSLSFSLARFLRERRQSLVERRKDDTENFSTNTDKLTSPQKTNSKKNFHFGKEKKKKKRENFAELFPALDCGGNRFPIWQ